MKLLYLDQADFIGGAELFTADLLATLPADFEITLLTGYPPKWHLPAVSVMLFAFPRLRPFRPVALIASVVRLRRLAKTCHADLIHSNSVRTGLVAAFSGLPFTHFAQDFTTPKLLAPILNKAQLVFCCSEAVKNDLVAKGVDDKKLRVIPSGIRLPAEYHAKHPGPDARIAIVGRLDPWKGQNVFLDAAALLHSRFPRARFLIFGEASSHDPKTLAFADALQQRVKSRKMDFVEFRGFVPSEKVYQEADLIVHASTQPEPLGRTIIEALAHGIPVVASDAGGARETLTGPLSCFLVAPGDAAALAGKITEILTSPALRQMYHDAARHRARDYDLTKINDRVFAAWRTALN